MQTAHDPYFSATDKAKPRARCAAARLIARTALQAIVVVAFTGLVAGSVWLFYHGYARPVAAAATLGLMAAAALVGDTWRERVVAAVAALCLVAGGVAGFYAYIALFRFRWFEAAFNHKGSGPAGLLLFVVGFSVAGGLSGGWVSARVLGLRNRPAAPPAA